MVFAARNLVEALVKLFPEARLETAVVNVYIVDTCHRQTMVSYQVDEKNTAVGIRQQLKLLIRPDVNVEGGVG